jgi:predicted butyrate kinase (DUF1464 family)
MKPSFLLGIGFVVSCALASGCDSTAAKKVEDKSKAGVEAVKSATKEGVKEVKDAAASAADMAREAVVKPIQELLPKIEDKITSMSGDAKTKATEKLEEVKKLLEEVKAAAPDKWEALKSKLAAAFDELKKMVGM